MPRFHNLSVTDVRKTTRDAVVINLAPAQDADFDFIQGQYLTFRKEFDGTEVRRSYSICAGKNEGILQVGIKQVAGGVFSTWANEDLEPGMVLEAMEPMGTFHTKLDPESAKSYLCFAAGSGITPVLSIMKTILNEEPNAQFTLVYSNRGVNTIMFREELEGLKNLYMGRVNIIHILGGNAQEIKLFRGRVDKKKCDELFKSWIDIKNIDMAFICGPEPMMLEVAGALKDHGLTEDQIKFELFGSSQHGRVNRTQSASQAAAMTVSMTEATITLDGATHIVEMPKDISILEAALRNSLDVPYACRAGVCSTCKCKVLEGEVEMVANHALEDYEVERGYILSCQSFAVTDKVVVDYDQR